MRHKVCDEIIYPSPHFNSAADEVCECIIILTDILLGMWSFIHAGIKFNTLM